MSQPRESITIHDVAREAGVSVSTVSRVLNDKADVAESTYSRVKSVIAELGYTSSLAAKSMRSRQTNVIGLIVPTLDDPFPIEVMKGVNQAIVQFNYDLIVFTSGDFRVKSSAQKESQYVSLLNHSITDGVIILVPSATSFATNAPVVAVDPNNESPNCPAVIATNRDGALAAMRHLIDLGHARIGFVGGRNALQSSLRRQQGYVDGLEMAGLPVDPALIQEGDFSQELGYRCGHKLLSLAQPPTAIFAANDQSAFGVIKAAQELGLKVPNDLSVIGFDNIPESAFSIPGGLTTVDQGLHQMGFTATEMLVSLIKGETLPESLHRIPTQLVIRGSCRAI